MPSRRAAVLLASLIALALPVPSVFAAERSVPCEPTIDRSHSVARHWDEALLEAIRRDFPAPTIHSRNLFHVSAAMWDAWAAYDPTADGVFVNRKAEAAPEDVQAARETAMSYAAYRILSDRYRSSPGVEKSQAGFDAIMDSLCLPTDRVRTRGDSPASLGNRIAARIHRGRPRGRLAPGGGLRAGRLRAGQRADDRQAPGDHHGRSRTAGSRSRSTESIAQNGLPLPDGVQKHLGPHWGHVTPFAIPPGAESGVPIDPGLPPQHPRRRWRGRLQGSCGGGHPPQQPARRDRRRHGRYLAGRAERQLARRRTTGTATSSTRSRASPTSRTSSRAATTPARWPRSGRTGRGRRRPRGIGTRSRTRRSTRPTSAVASAAPARSSTRSSGT